MLEQDGAESRAGIMGVIIKKQPPRNGAGRQWLSCVMEQVSWHVLTICSGMQFEGVPRFRGSASAGFRFALIPPKGRDRSAALCPPHAREAPAAKTGLAKG